MLKYFSKFYEIPELDEACWFDPCMCSDTLLFIDPFLVFDSNLPLFEDAQEKILSFFASAFELAHEVSLGLNSNAYKKLKGVLKFPEVQELCLGFSKDGTSGSGAGGGYSKGFADALVKLAETGHTKMERFEEIQIFTLGIGKDRISDATANLLKQDLILYTQEICESLNIPTSKHLIKNVKFDPRRKRWTDCVFSLPSNPFSEEGERAVILVPKAFLCDVQAIGTENFEAYIVANKNEELRTDLNYEIEAHLKSLQKRIIVDVVNRHPHWLSEYKNYTETEADIHPYDLIKDTKKLYRNDKVAYSFVVNNPIELTASNNKSFLACVQNLIGKFKLFIESETGKSLLWEQCQNDDEGKRELITFKNKNEATVQQLFSYIVLEYLSHNNIKAQNTNDTGKSIFELTFPNGYRQQTLIEVKLARNSVFQPLPEKKEEYNKAVKAIRNHINLKAAIHRHYLILSYSEKEKENLLKLEETLCKIIDDGVHFELTLIDATHSSVKDNKRINIEEDVALSDKTHRNILFLSSNPINTSRLQLDKECRAIEESLNRAKNRDFFKFKPKLCTTIKDLRRSLLDYSPEVLHFSGHSDADGIFLEDENGIAVKVEGASLANLLNLFSGHIKCVLLNACYSESQALLIAEHIDYVIGMKKAIGNNAAIKFSEGFYDALYAGQSFEKAYFFGRNAIEMYSLAEHLTPTLIKDKKKI